MNNCTGANNLTGGIFYPWSIEFGNDSSTNCMPGIASFIHSDLLEHSFGHLEEPERLFPSILIGHRVAAINYLQASTMIATVCDNGNIGYKTVVLRWTKLLVS